MQRTAGLHVMCSLFLSAFTKTGKARLILINTFNIQFHQNRITVLTSACTTGDEDIRKARLTPCLYTFSLLKCQKSALNGRYGSKHVTRSNREKTQSKMISVSVMRLILQDKILYALTRRDIGVGVVSRLCNGQPRDSGSIP